MPRSPLPPAPAGRPRRRFRALRIVAIVLLVLFVVGVAGFTWFAYWPLEGTVDRVEALVPAEVDFLYRTSWREIRDSGWLEKNLVDRPVHPDLAVMTTTLAPVGMTGRRALDSLTEAEDEINASIPGPLRTLESLFFGTREFRVEKDLFPGDIVAAGRWCSGGSPDEGLPRAREVLLLTRVTPLVKFAFEAVRHDFVRERALSRPDLEVEELPDGTLRAETKGGRQRRPETCEGGLQQEPLNVWYILRVKDVIAITNSEDLAGRVRGVSEGYEERAIDRPGFDVDRPEGGISAAIDMPGLRSYLQRWFDRRGEADTLKSVVAKFLSIDALDRLEGRITLQPDGISMGASVAYSDMRLRQAPAVAESYALLPSAVMGGIARLVPERDTALVAQVRSSPLPLLETLWDGLSASDRKIVEDNLKVVSRERRQAGKAAYEDVPAFLRDLSDHLGLETGIAIARMSSVFREDDSQFREWYSFADPVPSAALAVVINIRAGARQVDVDEFLSDRVGALGFRAPERVTSPDGLTYSRLRFRLRLDASGREAELPPELRDIQPAFVVHDNRLILSNREDYLLAILKTMAGTSQSVASTAAFRTAFGALPPDATLALWANGQEVRKLLWDLRNTYVRRAHDDRAYAADFRARRIAELTRGGGRTDFQKLQQQVDEDVRVEMERYRTQGYAQFIQDYRERLDAMGRIVGAGLVLTARKNDERLDLGVRLLFSP